MQNLGFDKDYRLLTKPRCVLDSLGLPPLAETGFVRRSQASWNTFEGTLQGPLMRCQPHQLQATASKSRCAGEGADSCIFDTPRPSSEQRMASYLVEPKRQSKMTMNLISITAAQATTIVIETCFSLATDMSLLTSSVVSKHHVSKIVSPRAQIHAAAWFFPAGVVYLER